MFHERLRKLRNQAQLSQMALAVRAGLTVSTIHALESGRQEPGLGTLRQLAKALNVNLDTLAGKPEPQPA